MKRALLASLGIVALAIGPSCQLSDSSPTSPAAVPDTPSETVIDLNSPTGGYTFTNEEPAFGEEALFAPMMNEAAVADDYENDEEVQVMIRNRHVKMYRLRALWGHLVNAYRDSTNADFCRIDWTGTLHLDGGAIIIERIIAFEEDEYVTRIDRSTISWISHTGPHVDGIQVRLIVPPGPIDSSRTDCIPTLTFKTGPYTGSFTIDELAALNFLRPVDRCNNYISINSHIIPPSCPHGYLAGTWKKTEPDTIFTSDETDNQESDSTRVRGIVLGVYRGIWIGHKGAIAGYLKGVYGINNEGERVFFGKYIDMYGRFKGILKGQYGSNPDVASVIDHHTGWFTGHWIGENRMIQGRLKGRWVADEYGWGHFHGIWGMNCTTNL